ncbi:MAG: translesion DNA synthesis-associated protein ImuA [Granulosicoccaceae bacterium]
MASLDQLLQGQPLLWRGHQHPVAQRTAPTGQARLDAFLPGGGWPLGALTELHVPGLGGGELSLLTPALAQQTTRGERVALVAPPAPPYPPALAAAGVVLSQLWVISPEDKASPDGKDALWSAEQLLRSGSFAVVLVWLPRATPTQLRRLQLAAETGGGCWAMAYRPEHSAEQSSPAALRLLWRQQQLQVLKCRGSNPGQLQLEDDTPPAHTPAHHWPHAANEVLV